MGCGRLSSSSLRLSLLACLLASLSHHKLYGVPSAFRTIITSTLRPPARSESLPRPPRTIAHCIILPSPDQRHSARLELKILHFTLPADISFARASQANSNLRWSSSTSPLLSALVSYLPWTDSDHPMLRFHLKVHLHAHLSLRTIRAYRNRNNRLCDSRQAIPSPAMIPS